MILKSLDTEVTGIDVHHEARPFIVTMCDGESVKCWEWDVDPFSRMPIIPEGDLYEIEREIEEADELILQNPKFDAAALDTLEKVVDGWQWKEFPWVKVRDTLLAGHLLASNHPHDLTSMGVHYLGVDIGPLEEKLKEACKEARKLARSRFPSWRIAKEGLPGMPSAKGGTGKEARGGQSTEPWKFDMWLPRAIAKELGYPEYHEWWTVAIDYANGDSELTLPLYLEQAKILKYRGLWEIYCERLKLLPVAYGMEKRGLSVSGTRLNALVERYKKESEEDNDFLVGIAKGLGHELVLPKSGNNNSLLDFAESRTGLNLCSLLEADNGQEIPEAIEDRQGLEGFGKAGRITLDKDALERFEVALDLIEPKGVRRAFLQRFRGKRSRDTAITYLASYQRFWIPIDTDENGAGWYLLHPSLNPTGTSTLRWSSSCPNEQNISKKENFNLRYCFGPLPGREWWSCDAQNIELRIPAFECHEDEMVHLFEHPEEPPFFGSYHMLIFETLHPEKFAKFGMKCKKEFESTWYQWTKNGNFAVQYGAQERSGTADRAYHVPGAQARIQGRFKKIKGLSDRMLRHAQKYGYVETIPDKNVCPTRGYPLLCTRSEYGKILPTVPLSYHVQGTAMWWMGKAKIRTEAQLAEWRREGFDGHIALQVHDELVFDFPKGKTAKSNLPRVRKLMAIMRQGGDDIGIPTPVSCKYHPDNWSEDVEV